jgi:hypothetical protein
MGSEVDVHFATVGSIGEGEGNERSRVARVLSVVPLCIQCCGRPLFAFFVCERVWLIVDQFGKMKVNFTRI